MDAHLGLFVGAAGNASALLSYYSDKTGKKITPVFEYQEAKYGKKDTLFFLDIRDRRLPQNSQRDSRMDK